jgi:hypothetical protein
MWEVFMNLAERDLSGGTELTWLPKLHGSIGNGFGRARPLQRDEAVHWSSPGSRERTITLAGAFWRMAPLFGPNRSILLLTIAHRRMLHGLQ